MAMATSTLLSLYTTSSSLMENHQLRLPMFYLMFFAFSLVSLCVLFVSMVKRLRRTKEEDEKSTQNPEPIFRCFLQSNIDKTHQTHQENPLIVEILTSNPPKCASLNSSLPSHLSGDNDGNLSKTQLSDGSELDKDEGYSNGEDSVKNGDQRGKKKKKRAKKKRQNSQSEDGCLEGQVSDLDSSYPFTSLSSATQRKIKQQFDQLVKSHDSKALTLAQVCQFANCLIEARTELEHKSEIIQRKFTITKALLFKADRSSFDRLCQQIYKLEAEQKRVEEDAVVYNRLQQQLKLSPAYKKMLEIGAQMELKAGSSKLVESRDTEFTDISFEELLAQEKKDSFWQRNGKLRSCTS